VQRKEGCRGVSKGVGRTKEGYGAVEAAEKEKRTLLERDHRDVLAQTRVIGYALEKLVKA
jgi:hypothetical protein